MTHFKLIKRSIVVGTITLFVVALSALPAFAHTTISPKEATAGGYGAFAFRVPNESDTASTVKLEVSFPEEYPIASIRTTDQDGWKATVEKGAPSKKIEAHGKEVKEVVKKITWDGGKIEPGKYAEFHVSMGPLPEDTDQLIFKAVQTYDDGMVSRWIDEPTKDGKTPEKPAPVLTLLKADDSETPTPRSGDKPTNLSKEVDEKTENNNALVYVSLGVGIVALLVGVGALTKKK